jgi:hypothetical protein
MATEIATEMRGLSWFTFIADDSRSEVSTLDRP